MMTEKEAQDEVTRLGARWTKLIADSLRLAAVICDDLTTELKSQLPKRQDKD